MSTSLFTVQEHVLPCQHIRGYPRSTARSQEEVLHIAIKQYTPLDNRQPKPGDVTIIGAHANGFPKELYEPLWDELLHRAKKSGISVRGIWIADVAFQGASGVLNEGKLGNDPSWFDHPRDLLHMVNHFRDQMPRPLIGIGHSMGGNNLVNLSLHHPRLLETLILIDPVIQRFSSAQGNYAPAQASTFRRDRWPSRQAAAAAFKRSKFYQAWDPRVLNLWIKHGLRDLPTPLYPTATPASSTPPPLSADPSSATASPAPDTEKEVTLTTTKHHEVFTFLRPNFPTPSHPNPGTQPDRRTHPDVDLTAHPTAPFYRPEPIITFANLPHLRPSVLYLFGSESPLSGPAFRRDKMATTGVGVGGSGGAPEGRVREVLFDGAGHLIPMEIVGQTADECLAWLGPKMARWREGEEAERRQWAAVPERERVVLEKEYIEKVGGMVERQKKGGSKL
ncbi:hypothetical protein B0A49_05348 [Cryomyces minteri]|uniref:Serine aminopeptidase S33 domain-containing protein n=1 Tax=Cryomyces minteri TaxID=331657 RepID=A0A4U0X1B5_9PEZI|nr:hypothetical protein B0A49_09009 [Cryomyces minteri]TKA68878.1 hypothetical protein B0A49_05348 [Cryomyces minteri]